MKSITRKWKVLNSDPKLPLKVILHKIAIIFPTKLYLKLSYRLKLGKQLNLYNPKTFNEKLQWLKINNRKAEYTNMVDKIEAKKYVASIIGYDHIIPTIAEYDQIEDIDWNGLPNQFVMKCTHDSGGIIICKDKAQFNVKNAIKKLKKGLNKSYYYQNREWPYKNVKPRIICEEYKVDESGYELKDYKLFCFNGVVKCLKVDFNRAVDHHANYYDQNWNILKFGESKFPPDYTRKIEKPTTLEKMIFFAEQLSQGIPFVRIDFYSIKDKVFFGEITFFPASGMGKFTSDKWDEKLGSWIELPNNN